MYSIVLLLTALVLISNINIAEVPDFQLSDQTALTWQSFNRFRWRRPKPTTTPAPVVTPERRPVMTPVPPASVDLHLNTERTAPAPVNIRAVPTMSPRGSSSDHQTTKSESNSGFRALEREINVLYTAGQPIGPDHFSRLQVRLDDLARKREASPSDLSRLRSMLDQLNPANRKSSPLPSSSDQNCPSQVNPVLIADITDLSKVKSVTAPGTPSSEGPKGHSFINTDHAWVAVYAPVDGVLDSGAYYKDSASSPAQYLFFFNIKGSCGFQFKFDHIDEPIVAIRAVLPTEPKTGDSRGSPPTGKAEVKAGDLIGYTSGTSQAGNWDFGLYNSQKEGPLARYGGTGSHRQAVCWVDYYSSAKQPVYRKLLNGGQLVCSFSGSTTPTPETQSSSSGSPVIKNLGVLFAPWGRDTNRAGAFTFTSGRDKLFLEYGAEVSSPTGTKVLPTFEYYTAIDADVFAAVDGEVLNVSYQDRDHDYEILIQPDGAPQWTLGQDHVTNLKVSKGMRVKAGDVLGKVGTSNGYGRTEIMLWTSGPTAPLTYCPTKFFDSQLRSSLEQKINQHIKDWEEFKGNSAIYSEEKYVFPGCAFEKREDR